MTQQKQTTVMNHVFPKNLHHHNYKWIHMVLIVGASCISYVSMHAPGKGKLIKWGMKRYGIMDMSFTAVCFIWQRNEFTVK